MKANDINEFLGTLLQSVTDAHKMHLATKKFSVHKALNEYYDDAPEAVDALVEAWQGVHGVADLKALDIPADDPVKYFTELKEMADAGRDAFIEEDELKSECDNVIALIDQTLYKLKELKENRNRNGMNTTLYEAMAGLKSLQDYINEKCTTEDDGCKDCKKHPITEEGEIESEKDFREYAENKFKEAFGDDLDTERMNETIDGILDDNQDLVKDGNWGELVGKLNQSFAK